MLQILNPQTSHPKSYKADDFAEAFLGFLLNLATAKDKVITANHNPKP